MIPPPIPRPSPPHVSLMCRACPGASEFQPNPHYSAHVRCNAQVRSNAQNVEPQSCAMVARQGGGCAFLAEKTCSEAGVPRMESGKQRGGHNKSYRYPRVLEELVGSHTIRKAQLECWHSEHSEVGRIELTVRSVVIRTLPPRSAGRRTYSSPIPRPRADLRGAVNCRLSASHAHDARGGSPLDPV